MTTQLHLLDATPAWRLDRATRTQGLEGVRRARAVLRAVAARQTAEAADPPPAGVTAEAA